MGYTLQVKNPCRCFMRDGGAEHQNFATQQEAAEEAEALHARMEKNYCKKHRFVLSHVGGNYTIAIMPREMK
jgi:hypothetical protein